MLNRNQRNILISITFLLGAILFGKYTFLPLINDFQEKYNQVKKINADREKVTGTMISLKQMQSEKLILEKKLEKLNLQLPSNDQMSILIGQISKQTESLPVEVLSVTGGDLRSTDDPKVKAKDVFYDLRCDFKTLSEYVHLMKQVDTIITINKVHVEKRPDIKAPHLSVRLQIETYIGDGV